MYYISIRQGSRSFFDRMRKHPRAPGIQTPSYILSPLDLGPNKSLECPFLFLLSFLSGHSETPPATAAFFLFIYLYLIIFLHGQIVRLIPNANCPRIDPPGSAPLTDTRHVSMHSYHVQTLPDCMIHISRVRHRF